MSTTQNGAAPCPPSDPPERVVWLVVGAGFHPQTGGEINMHAVFDTSGAAREYASHEALAQRINCRVYEETVNDPDARVLVFESHGADE